MRRLLLALLILSASGAVAAPRGAWPSLAKRPGETEVPGKPSKASAGDAPGSGQQAAGPVADAAARLAIAARDVDQLEQRWRAQAAVSQQPQTGARGVHSDPDAAAAAQLEGSRLDKLSGQIADERALIETITGDLAIAAAAGRDVGEPLRAAGSLLSRCARLTSGSLAGRDTGRTATPAPR